MKKLFFAFSSILVILMSLIGIGQVTKVVQQNVTQNQYEQQQEELQAEQEAEASADQYSLLGGSLTGSFVNYSSTVASGNRVYFSLAYDYVAKTGASCGSNRTVTLQFVQYNKGSTTPGNVYVVDTWSRVQDPTTGTNLNVGDRVTYTGYYTLTFIPNFTLYDYRFRVTGWGNLSTTGGTCTTVQEQIISAPLATPSPVTFVSYSWTTTPDTSTSSSVGTFTYSATVNNPTNNMWWISTTVEKVSGPGAAYSQTKSFGKGGATVSQTNSQTWTGLEAGTTYRATVNRNTAYGEIIGWSNMVFTFTIGSAVSEPTATATSTATDTSTGNDGSITNTASITTQSDQYVHSYETSIDGGSTWVSDETGVAQGTTGTLTTTHSNLAVGTYTVKSRITYTSDSGNYLVKNLPDNTVTVNSGSVTYQPPTININYSSTNTTTPVASDGKITATYTCATNCNNNIIGVEIREVGGSTWYDVTTGITGLTDGSYDVEYRISYDTSSAAGNQQAYTSNSSPQSVTVNATPYGAPTASFAVTSTNDTTPGTPDNGTVTVTPTVTPVSGTAEIYYRVENTPSTNGWVSSITGSTYTKSGLAVGTYYADVYVMYDADGNVGNGNEARLDLPEQTITVAQNPWTAPVLSFTAVEASSSSIDVDVNVDSGDYQAIQNVYIEVTTLGGTVIDSHQFAGSEFSTGSATHTFSTGIAPGNYYVNMYYTYDIGNGSGLQTTTTYQLPVNVASNAMPTILTGSGVGAGTEDNATTSTSADGSYTNTFTFTDTDSVIESSGHSYTLYKYNESTGTWVNQGNTSFTGTTFTVNPTGLTQGFYRYDLNINVDTGFGPQVVKFVAPTAFVIGKDSLDPVTVSQQGYYVDDYKLDTNTGNETYDITYYLTTNNIDSQQYSYKVELIDKNGTDADVVVDTQYVTRSNTVVTFNDVLANEDYEIVITYSSGATVGNIDTSYDLTGQTQKESAGISLDDASGYTAYSYTDSSNNQTGTITTTMIINNPDNLFYSYDVVLYDYSTLQEVDRVTFTSTTEDCDINVFTVDQLDVSKQYYIQIENAQGALPTSLYTEFNGLGIASFTPAPTTQNTNWMTPVKASVISVGAIAIVGLIATSTYVVIRRKAAK